MKTNTLIIGSGMGGYPAAVVLAKRGVDVTLVEEDLVGGECTNYGCIPSKALLYYAEIVKASTRLGLKMAETPSLKKALKYAQQTASEDRESLTTLLSKAGVELIHARARLAGRVNGKYRVKLEKAGKKSEIEAEKIILAPGSNPLIPSWVQTCSRVLDNRALFTQELEEANTIAVVGGGAIGVELSQALASIGLEVEVYEAYPRLLPGLGDKDVSLIAARTLKLHGVKTHTSTPVERVKCKNGKRVEVCSKKTGCKEYDYAVIALGRKPRTENLGLEELGILDPKGFIKTGTATRRTQAPNIYASGDATGPPFLAHKAAWESLAAAISIMGERRRLVKAMPIVVYGEPEILVVEKLNQSSQELVSVKNYWGYNAIARIRGIKPQVVYARIDYEKQTRRIVKAVLAGPHVSEIAGELVAAIESDMRVEDLEVIHPHPSASEAVYDIVLSVLNLLFNKA